MYHLELGIQPAVSKIDIFHQHQNAPILTGGLLRPNIRLSPNGKSLYRPDTLAILLVGTRFLQTGCKRFPFPYPVFAESQVQVQVHFIPQIHI